MGKSPVLWGPSLSNDLQSGIQFNNGASVQQGSVNPASVATAGLPGSLYMNNATAVVYIKQDSGTTTNWLAASLGAPVLSSYSLSTNQAVTGGGIIKFNAAVSDASGLYNTSTGLFTFATSGLYLFGIVTVSSGTSNVLLYKNGGTIQTYISTTSGMFGSGSLVAVVTAGDTFEFVSESSVTYSGGTAPITCSMFAMLISGSTGGGGGSGTVTSVAQTVPSDLTITGSPITTSGTLAITRNTQLQNLFMASPNGSTGVPVYRSIVAADVPTLNQNTTGTAASVTGTNVVTNTNLSQMPTNTIKGNNTGGTANAADLTVAQVNALLGTVPPIDIQTFSSSGTWTKPTAGTPKKVTLYLVGAGAGGGSGRKGTTSAGLSGGGSGSTGSFAYFDVLPSMLGATEAVTIGAGGAGGPSITVSDTNGTTGSIGGSTSINIYKSPGGKGGTGGAAGAGSTGGAASGATTAFSIAGLVGTNGLSTGGNANTSLILMPTPGGAGGGVSTVAVASAGGTGGGIGNAADSYTTTTVSGVAGGAINTAGTNGGTTTYILSLLFGMGGGGGGASVTTNAGAGGNGGAGGGSGGGGGASIDVVGNSGAGGAGGNGYCVVVTEF